MTHPSLIVQGANHAAKRLSEFCAFHPHHAKDLQGSIPWIKLAAQQLQRDEVFMSAVAEAIRYERSEKEKAQAQVADLTAQLAASNAEPKLDADDQAEVAKTQGEQAAPVVTPASDQVAPA